MWAKVEDLGEKTDELDPEGILDSDKGRREWETLKEIIKYLIVQMYHDDLTLKNIYSGSMRDLTAQVTSGLLQFPEVTIQALGEDEITLESVLRGKFAAAVVTDVGQILLIDLCLDDLSCSQNEVEASDLEVITGIPAEVPHIRENVMREGRHLCFQYFTQLEGGRVPVYAVTFQEPENDPRNCCYLWAVQSTQDSEGDVLSLHLLQLAFGDRKCLASGQILYEGLEYCEERYTLDLTGGMFPLRGQTGNTKLLGCQSIEKFRSHGDREEGMNEGLMDLSNKYMVSQLICQYAQVVLWFSHSGLLPEGLDDAVQLSRLYYNYPVIQNYYTSRRQKCERLSRGKWNPDYLMIDGMVSQLGDRVEKLWKRDEGGTGKYPPTSLHTIYLLLDIMYSFPNKTDTSIESFPTAFAISWGQVKLIQGFWLIDHNDYESGLDLLFHPATAKPLSWQHSKIIQAFMSQGEHRQALRYIQTMKPTVSSGSDVILHLTVLLSNRLNIEELLKHTYEVCQEMGLMEDLLKLPFTDTEQECLVRFLQSSASVQNHEFLLVHHLQRANYIPALKLNQTLKINLMNDRDPRLRERSVARNSILDQYGKILPRVQRKLAIERAKPYHVSTSSVLREELPEAFVGTPISKASQKISRLLDLIVHPVPQPSQCLGFIQQTLIRSPLYLASSSLPKAKTLAMSVTSSGYAEFTPQSILRSGLRTTPLASPSLSPGRSLTPPSRLKETRISFMEEGMTIKWTAGAADDSKTKAFVTVPFHKCGVPAETEWLKDKDKTTSFRLNSTEEDHQEMDVRSQDTTSQSLEKLDMSIENSNASTRSDQTTLEYQDARLPEDFENSLMASKPVSSSTELITNLTEQTEKDSDKDVFESEVTPPDLEKQTAMADVLGGSGSSGLITSESPVVSEDRLDQEIALNLKEDHEVEVDILKASVDIPEEPPISDDPPDSQEIHVIEHEKLEVQDSEQEARNLSCNELYPSGTLKLQYNFDTIEQQFCDLPDNKDSAECDIAEVDGELFVAQSNFTLILEGEEGEVETGDSAASNVLAKAANTATEEKLVNSGENENHSHVANVPSVITSDQESQKVETLPYVPEPIKVAIAENLLDVIKDTRSKEITSDTMEQSIHENIPLISQKVMRSTRLAKSTFKTVQETSTVTINVSQVDDVISSRTRKKRRVQNMNVKSAQQEESADVATPEKLGLSVTKKTRKTKEVSEAFESVCCDGREVSQNQQIPQSSITPRRGRRKKEINQDTLETVNSIEQELQVTPGRELRRLKSSQPLEPATEETFYRKEVKLSSVTKRAPKRMKKSVENEESVEIINDLKVSKVASPSRSTRKLRHANLETSENVGYKQDEESIEQQLPIRHSKRVKKREVSASDVIGDSKHDSSQLTLQAEFDTPATPRKRGRPRKNNPSEDAGSKAVKEARSPRKAEGLSIQRRSTRNTPAKSENTDVGKPALEKSVLVPDEELATATSSKKRLTKSVKHKQCTFYIIFPPNNNTNNGKMMKMPMPSIDRVKVAVRVRPFSQREKNSGSKCVISMHSRTTIIQDPKNPEHMKMFTFDLAYWSHNGFQKDKDGVFISADPSSKFAGQRDVFHDLGRGILDSAWQGYNTTLLAYGQTGSGKSYSMIGFGANKGIIPNVCEELFKAIENREKNQEYQVRDLLSRTKKPGGLKVREDQQLGFYVDGLKSVPCENYAQIERLMEQGTKIRTTASTNMNASSSRSHMVITIQFKQVFLDRDLTKQSSINLVDLAGSERQKSSGSEGDRLREGSRVNLSLTNLGNVISALADEAMGKKVLHIPYRDSVLTKLLQSALGGNSRTTLIAAISPADICYEETLSTLRYAERAKKIQNKATVNTSTLLRESRTENKLLLGCGNCRMAELPACLLAEQGLWPPTSPMTWARQLEQAQREWQQHYMAIAQEQQMMKSFPHLLNVNEDPQLTGVLKISDKHASFTNLDGKVTVTPHSKCKVVINGVPITTKTKLQHLVNSPAEPQDFLNPTKRGADRIILGSNSAYLYIGLPSERGGEDLSRYDYDFFQLERAAAEGVSVDKLGAVHNGAGKADPSVLAVFQDYIKLMPLVAEANQMSEELRKVWIWSKAKFINRKFLMEELYQRFLDGEDSHVAQEDDPFWDPVEVIHLGSAHIWLQSLAYCMKFEEQVEFLNCDGLREAVLHIHITPCFPTGQYRIYDLPNTLYTKPVWKIVNPQIEETIQFTALNASQEFLNYLQTNALIVDLWGLQEGCAELSCSWANFMVTSEGHIMVDTKKSSTMMDPGQTTSNQISELYLKLLKLEQETDLLRNINRVLRVENVFLKESLEKIGACQQVSEHQPLNTLKIAGMTARLPAAKEISQMGTQQASYDREFAKALKVFYQSMNVARGQFLKLRHYKPPVSNQNPGSKRNFFPLDVDI
ncbi:Protein ELYS [Camelus dromedarius]|uniref:Protein ELYS n=1 Tax=Camelus dromedarius TaxID=9838 RepID=A0A5N4CKA7_CAMDR|nr:Protein ELYS [Camelus dromedarius]